MLLQEPLELKPDNMYNAVKELEENTTLAYLAKEFFGYTHTKQYKDLNGNSKSVSFYSEPSLKQIANLLTSLSERCNDLSSKEESLRTIANNTSEQYCETSKQVIQHKKENTQLVKDLEAISLRYEKIEKILKKYGGHKSDCAYIETVSCGRILKTTEKENCTCGWYEIKNNMKTSIDAIFEDKKENTVVETNAVF